MKKSNPGSSRRGFLKSSGIAIAMAAGLAPLGSHGAEKIGKSSEDISPAEDLMREHGVLARALLVYDEISLRIDNGKEFPVDALYETARLIQRFVENYHEKLEENYLFPRFEKTGRFVDLVKVLLAQHQAGRRLTSQILALPLKSLTADEKGRLKLYLGAFCRMYRPHKAREDTVLFPAFHTLVSAEQLDALGESFEDKEVELFGAGGFEKIVDEVAGIEKRLDIYDLSQFPPRL